MNALFDSLLVDESLSPGQIVIQPLFGGSQKAVRTMTTDDFQAVSDGVIAKVREQAFSRGLPIVYEVNGHTVREYADGHIESLQARPVS